jgi:hypothetical protein
MNLRALVALAGRNNDSLCSLCAVRPGVRQLGGNGQVSSRMSLVTFLLYASLERVPWNTENPKDSAKRF